MASRRSNGQFAPGHPGGPGRPARVTETSYLVAMSEIVSLDDWKAIVEKAREQALAGDNTARKWLAEYLLGSNPNLARAQALYYSGMNEENMVLLELAANGLREGLGDHIRPLIDRMKELNNVSD